MKLLLKRTFKGEAYTIGHLYIDGEYFCDTIEDKDRGLRKDMNIGEITRLKVYGETAIPTGTYKVNMTFSPKYKRIMPQIMCVPGYTGIRIHSGNTQDDSLGCIIVGENKVRGRVINSRITYTRLMERLDGIDNIEIEIA